MNGLIEMKAYRNERKSHLGAEPHFAQYEIWALTCRRPADGWPFKSLWAGFGTRGPTHWLEHPGLQNRSWGRKWWISDRSQ